MFSAGKGRTDMQRRDFIKQSAGTLLAISLAKGAESWGEALQQHRNLLFITVDDMNWSLPGFMGNPLGLTPNLDKLAKRSHRFTRNRAAAPICQPSREAMMTGRYPHRSGGLGFDPIRDGVPTLTTTLKEAGYFTVGIHKLNHMQPKSCFPWDYIIPGKGRGPSEYGNAVREGIKRARDLKQPFFINCNLNDPHRPFYGSLQAAEVDHNEQGEYRVQRELKAEDVQAPSCLEDLPDIRKEFAQYCNSAQRMDVTIGKVLDALAEAPEAENTIIFFSADHGMPFPFSKATVYDWGTRTPALLCYPGMGDAKTFEDRTCNIDYMPTLLDLMAVKAPEGIDGKSWMPILRGEKSRDREYQFTQVNGVSSGAQYPMRAIQDDRYSLIFMPWSNGSVEFKVESMQGLTFEAMKRAAETNPKIALRVKQYIEGVPLAFYDLQKDPDQRVNVISHPEHRERVEKMRHLLLDYMKRTEDPQLENFEQLLAGKPTIVKQPERLHTQSDARAID